MPPEMPIEKINAEKFNAVIQEYKQRFIVQQGLATMEYSQTFDFLMSVIMECNTEIRDLKVKNKSLENELEVLRKK